MSGSLVAGEADEAELAGLPRGDERLDGAARGEDALRVVHADDLVDLHQIDDVGLAGAASDCSSCCAAASLVRPSIFVIRKTLSR